MTLVESIVVEEIFSAKIVSATTFYRSTNKALQTKEQRQR
jgi:hypothetical protein